MGSMTYLAIDVHRDILVAKWGRKREQARTASFAHTTEGLAALRKQVGRVSVWAAYEAGSAGFALGDELSSWSWRVTILAPTGIPRSAKHGKRKTDREDAAAIFDLLVAHAELGTKLPGVWVPPKQVREDREVVRRRLDLGQKQAQVKAQIGSLLLRQGIRRPSELKTKWTQKYRRWLEGLGTELGPATGQVLESLLWELEMLEEAMAQQDQEVAQLSVQERYERPVKELVKHKGVALLTAMVFLVELGDVRRFASRRALGSYLGLTPSCYESAGADRKSRISRQGPWRIRRVLNQAAWACARTDPAAHAFFTALAARRGRKKALVALMRRVGIQMWRTALAA